jgi:hypothetical protein
MIVSNYANSLHDAVAQLKYAFQKNYARIIIVSKIVKPMGEVGARGSVVG